jgi:hypothetical protein
MEKRRLAEIEEYIFDLFRHERRVRLLTRSVFESTSTYTNGDMVRAFEDLEKKHRLLVRYTEEGNDWVRLTPAGAEHAGLGELPDDDAAPTSPPHPPKSST